MRIKNLFIMMTITGFAISALSAQEAAKTETAATTEVQSKEPAKKEASFKARIYAQYEAQLKEVKKGNSLNKGELTNAFDITRVYLRWTNYITDNVKVHATTDIGRVKTNGNTKDLVAVYLKYAYFRYGAVKKEQQKGSFAWYINAGQFATPWIDMSDNFRKYRFVAKTDIDDNKLETSSDIGVGGKLFFADKLITLEAVLQNGEGYKSPETNNYKAGRGLLGVHPVMGDMNLSIVGYGSYNQTDVDTSQLIVGPGLQLAYKKMLKLQLSYMLITDKVSGTDTKGNSLSVFGSFSLNDIIGIPLEIAGQLDLYDPDQSTGNDKTTKVIGGLVYRPIKQIALSLDFMSKRKADSAVLGTSGTEYKENSEQAVFVHSEFNF